MKVGILTFHSQLNYGGVLQCWALQEALRSMGHDVFVVDRRLTPCHKMFGGIVPMYGMKEWIKWSIRALTCHGDFAWLRRCLLTSRFIKQNLRLTPYNFYDWAEAPADLKIDILVVGSDQVWHCGDWGDPFVYLLYGAPNGIPAIAYAASFGMSSLPEYISDSVTMSERILARPVFCDGLSRFRHISCREKMGVGICKGLGFTAAHVVDPTLLALYHSTPCTDVPIKEDRLVCYFMGIDVREVIFELEQFAKEYKCRVKVLIDATLIPFSKTFSEMLNNILWTLRTMGSCVDVVRGAGPMDFLHLFKSAKWVISDSFHALMFSIIYRCDVRVLTPTSDFRRRLFSRISEFAEQATGPILVASVKDAIRSFKSGEVVSFNHKWIQRRVDYSRRWIEESLK